MAVYGRYPLPLDNEPEVEYVFLVYEHKRERGFRTILRYTIRTCFVPLGFTGTRRNPPLTYICYMMIEWLPGGLFLVNR